MKKRERVLISCTVAVVGLFLTTVVSFMALDVKVVRASDHGGLQTHVTPDVLEEEYESTMITLNDGDRTYTYSYEDLGIETYFDDEKQDYIDSSFLVDLSTLDPTFYTDGLSEKLNELNEGRIDTKYATIEKNDDGFVATDEVKGNKIDIDKLSDYIIAHLDGTPIDLDLTEFYVEEDVTKPTYADLQEEVSKIDDTYVEYENGFKVSLKDYMDCLSFDGQEIEVDEAKLDGYKDTIEESIKDGLGEYDTVGNETLFTTHDGITKALSHGTWGNYFDADAETDHVLTELEEFGNETDRTPVYSQEMDEKLGDTYVEVSLADQHVWHYANGKLCCETDCVTGNCDGYHETPAGVYYICEMQNGRTLWPKGVTQGTYVNKWMRISWVGYGLHDAYWRSEFGGDIYKTDGSHGCVNLPKDYAYNLYDEVYIGMPVIIY
jgi:hypothetical protein